MEVIKGMLKSRKFWVLVLALVGVGAALATGDITVWQALQAAIAAGAAYSTGVAIEDNGRNKVLKSKV
jgi:hypothetical protein